MIPDSSILRIGLIGMDTSHVPAFTRLFNDPNATGDLSGFRVVAGLPDGSDTPMSRDRIAGFTNEARELGVEIVTSVEELIERSDRFMILSVDGGIHLRQAKELIAAGKPLFVDKPVAGSLADSITLYDLANRQGAPCFSASSLRFGEAVTTLHSRGDCGEILGATSWGPLSYQDGLPDLFFYGIHGIEFLFTVMGPGCESVTRIKGPVNDLVTGVWSGGRVGVYRGLLEGKTAYGITTYGSEGIVTITEEPSYEALCRQIGRFFRTGIVPVSPAETLEIYAFMEAAEESSKRDGALVSIAEVMERAASIPNR